MFLVSSITSDHGTQSDQLGHSFNPNLVTFCNNSGRRKTAFEDLNWKIICRHWAMVSDNRIENYITLGSSTFLLFPTMHVQMISLNPCLQGSNLRQHLFCARQPSGAPLLQQVVSTCFLSSVCRSRLICIEIDFDKWTPKGIEELVLVSAFVKSMVAGWIASTCVLHYIGAINMFKFDFVKDEVAHLFIFFSSSSLKVTRYNFDHKAIGIPYYLNSIYL